MEFDQRSDSSLGNGLRSKRPQAFMCLKDISKYHSDMTGKCFNVKSYYKSLRCVFAYAKPLKSVACAAPCLGQDALVKIFMGLF